MKKYVEEKIDLGFISVKDAIEVLTKYLDKEEALLNIEMEYDHYDNTTYYKSYVSYYRDETPEERKERLEENKQRLQKEKEDKEKKHKQEYENYLKLKEKFETNGKKI